MACIDPGCRSFGRGALLVLCPPGMTVNGSSLIKQPYTAPLTLHDTCWHLETRIRWCRTYSRSATSRALPKSCYVCTNASPSSGRPASSVQITACSVHTGRLACTQQRTTRAAATVQAMPITCLANRSSYLKCRAHPGELRASCIGTSGGSQQRQAHTTSGAACHGAQPLPPPGMLCTKTTVAHLADLP